MVRHECRRASYQDMHAAGMQMMCQLSRYAVRHGCRRASDDIWFICGLFKIFILVVIYTKNSLQCDLVCSNIVHIWLVYTSNHTPSQLQKSILTELNQTKRRSKADVNFPFAYKFPGANTILKFGSFNSNQISRLVWYCNI